MQKGRKRIDEVTKIPVSELVDARIDGKSFDWIAQERGLTKMIIYGYYCSFALDFGGYDPLNQEIVEGLLKKRNLTLPQIAERLGLPLAGLRNYMHDRQIDARTPHATRIKWMIQNGFTVNYMAQYYGLSHLSMTMWLDRHDIEMPNKAQRDGQQLA